MAVSAKMYGGFLNAVLTGEINFTSDNINVVLLDNTYTPDQDAHVAYGDLSGEISGTGYTSGGTTLTTPTLSYDAGTNTITMNADNPEWPTSTLTARYAVYYDATSGSTPLIGYVDFGIDVSSVAATFTVVLPSTGIATLSVA